MHEDSGGKNAAPLASGLKKVFLITLVGRKFVEMLVGHGGGDATTRGALNESGLD